ncbi:MAG: ABC transporter substrate-binding protein [Actinophytocola sp.]|nr:ABC transporter substrate-binding protein [Actinophytocola sp.]
MLLALVLTVALSACGDSAGSESHAGHEGNSDSSGAFPVTVEHKYGTTKIPSEPKRVVTLGLSDQDAVLALGIKPVGAVDWFKERPYGKWPWTDKLWGKDRPQIVGERDEYNMEKIAALQPDVIIAQYSGMKKEQYETLSEIAPVVAQPKGYADYQAPWQVMSMQIGKSLGKEAEMEKLISDVDEKFADVRKAHPEWKGKTVAIGEPYQPGKFAAFSPKDPKVDFLTNMGFTTSNAYEDVMNNQVAADLSFERLDVMDEDYAVWMSYPGTEKQLNSDPLYRKLEVSKENRDVFLPYENPDVGAALSFNTVLSIPYAIDETVPLLEAAK